MNLLECEKKDEEPNANCKNSLSHTIVKLFKYQQKNEGFGKVNRVTLSLFHKGERF